MRYLSVTCKTTFFNAAQNRVEDITLKLANMPSNKQALYALHKWAMSELLQPLNCITSSIVVALDLAVWLRWLPFCLFTTFFTGDDAGRLPVTSFRTPTGNPAVPGLVTWGVAVVICPASFPATTSAQRPWEGVVALTDPGIGVWDLVAGPGRSPAEESFREADAGGLPGKPDATSFVKSDGAEIEKKLLLTDYRCTDRA